MHRLSIILFVLCLIIGKVASAQAPKINTYCEISYAELEEAYENKDRSFFDTLHVYDYVSIYRHGVLQQFDIPSKSISLHHDFFLNKKYWRAEYFLGEYKDGHFELWIYDIRSEREVEVHVTPHAHDYFITFQKGSKEYWIPKSCYHCTWELREIPPSE